jgi:hypothetical protein
MEDIFYNQIRLFDVDLWARCIHYRPGNYVDKRIMKKSAEVSDIARAAAY